MSNFGREHCEGHGSAGVPRCNHLPEIIKGLRFTFGFKVVDGRINNQQQASISREPAGELKQTHTSLYGSVRQQGGPVALYTCQILWP